MSSLHLLLSVAVNLATATPFCIKSAGRDDAIPRAGNGRSMSRASSDRAMPRERRDHAISKATMTVRC